MYHTLDLHFQNYEHAIASFCIESENGLILIESGPYSTYESLKSALKEKGLAIEEVKPLRKIIRRYFNALASSSSLNLKLAKLLSAQV